MATLIAPVNDASLGSYIIGDWNLIDSDHAGVKLWLDVRKITKRGSGLFKVNGSLLENPISLQRSEHMFLCTYLGILALKYNF